MSTTRAITRIITVLFLLAGLLLLRKPVFGQAIIAVPTHHFDALSGRLIESSTIPSTSNNHRRDKSVRIVLPLSR
jgi:hypothetical protein